MKSKLTALALIALGLTCSACSPLNDWSERWSMVTESERVTHDRENAIMSADAILESTKLLCEAAEVESCSKAWRAVEAAKALKEIREILGDIQAEKE